MVKKVSKFNIMEEKQRNQPSSLSLTPCMIKVKKKEKKRREENNDDIAVTEHKVT